ncbi:MAG TPA: SMP-30/gluconolactonase/LRE family protein [Candidatus Hydrogenedentes bacterium]|nr:SMP-30/gluconolactonase/LRE family protein [Candidatus Hydrogenedentota bacterium]HOT50604.1 SMP-30/gluconolactonase/LRE family protein [Candidatus Hydrogenedentota bacterium]HOV74441.1 SMP-30/gluconolactonase/LRE family protein [Candidatus Hydrogenedentota bacterium]HPC16699.1 SMP-30/gluconolactonase/LRE family protein [Candidatus Hydrogenedentota bacterium]HRT21753.1 SMP-30/gluconolactonase/LRE family protein [Candidatus Hydrogenedentota bacterium]
MKPVCVADYACECGEGPLWHPFDEFVYWVDIPAGRLFRHDPASGTHGVCYEGEPLGGFTIQADGSLLLFMARGAVSVWRNGNLTTVIDEIPDEQTTRFNDVIADPVGRVFCGTMPTAERPGRLYRLNTDGTIVKLLDGVECPNGMGFTLDRRQLYFTDSGRGEISLFDYDVATGDLANRRIFVTLPKNAGCPDGMTVDEDGFVWSAIWDGGRLIRFAPDGREDRCIEFPARKVSSCIFGGRNYGDLYVTTAGGNNKDAEGPGAGGLFRVDAGIKGMPEFLSRVGLS